MKKWKEFIKGAYFGFLRNLPTKLTSSGITLFWLVWSWYHFL